jgi:RNA polymerase sigma factor (TIGR02999 family)
VTAILAAVEAGDRSAAARLLPLVYDELRRLAGAKMAAEPAGLTLQPTALVHEAYLRLVGEPGGNDKWANRAHFFSAAAEAMRRILVERARRVGRVRHGGGRAREGLDEGASAVAEFDSKQDPAVIDLIALDSALTKLANLDRRLSDVVMLRYFAGLSVEETAAATETSARTVKRDWEFARAWLKREMAGEASA